MILDDDDPDALLSLLYVSDLAAGLPAGSLGAIGRTSHRNNRRDGITGLLICDGTHFAQLTEGPTGPMRSLKDRIYADPRHTAITTLLFAQTGTSRRFPDWQMGFLALGGDGRLATLRAMRGLDAMERLERLLPTGEDWRGDPWPA